jgi:arylesterase/paraoxonase
MQNPPCLHSASGGSYNPSGIPIAGQYPNSRHAKVGPTLFPLRPSKTYPYNAELVLHQPSGLVYLACSTPHSRSHWTPALDRLNASGRSEFDYVATYDPRTDAINQLSFSGPLSPGGISLHGMDVVPSSDDSSLLYVYLVNHRKPISADARTIGADSVIEVFKTRIGSSTLEHLRTFQDPAVVITPNDVVGSPDGKSVHFTNDHRLKTGFVRSLAPCASISDIFLSRGL